MERFATGFDELPELIPGRSDYRIVVATGVLAPPQVSRPQRDLDEELARLRRENTELKQATKVPHSVILALTDENQRLARRRRVDAAVMALSSGDPKPKGKR